MREVHVAKARWQRTRTLARSYRLDVRAYAAVKRRRAEGRGMLAGSITAFWGREPVGPVLDSRPLACALVAALRNKERGELADQVELLPSVRR